MSALDFARSLAQSLTKTRKPAVAAAPPAQPQPQPQSVSNTRKKRFVHGNNVIMKRGLYKGYYGFVYEFYPGKYEVEIEEKQYVPIQHFGSHQIGDTILTHYGESRITNIVPVLYGMKIANTNEELRFPENVLTKVVVFMDGGILKIAMVVNNKTIKIIKTNEKSKEESALLIDLSNAIKEKKVKYDGEVDASSVKVVSEYIFVTKNSGNETDKKYIGTYGKLTRTIDTQYEIVYKKRFMVMPTGIKKLNNNLISIKHGAFKGQTAKLVKKHPAHLVVYLDAVGKKVSDHMIQLKGNYEIMPITPADVFYMDIKLKNGNFFEVKEISPDGRVIGLERVNNQLVPKEIAQTDIESLQPGFSFDTQVVSTNTSVDTEMVQDTEGQDTEENETDDTDDDKSDTFEYSQEPEQEREVELEMTSGFKDKDRISFQRTQLTKPESEIKSKITRILNLYAINDTEIKIFDLIEKITSSIEETRKILNKSEHLKDIWIKSDEKYIIAGFVFYEIIQSGNSNLLLKTVDDDIYDTFVEKLTANKFFSSKDTMQSIFLTDGWTPYFSINTEIIKTMKKKDVQSLYKMIFKNCVSFLKETFSLQNIDSKDIYNQHRLYLEDLIPLGGKRKGEIEKKYVTVTDIMNNDIPETAAKILWGPIYQPYLDKMKQYLVNEIKTAKTNTHKVTYEYVLDTIERAPFAIQEIEKLTKPTKRDVIKLQALRKAWNLLWSSIQKKYENLQNQQKNNLNNKQSKQKDESINRISALSVKTTLEEAINELKSESDDTSLKRTSDLMSSLTISDDQNSHEEEKLVRSMKKVKISKRK
jgi:hypothetical protein